MNPVLLIYFAFIWWLFSADRKRRHGCSSALWIPLIWLVIVGSKAPSTWFSPPTQPGGDTDGNPVDAFTFLFLLLAGIWVLKRRAINWSEVLKNNRWLVLFFAYLGLSVAWSGHPMPSLKQWIKDTGNIVMVLIILTEQEPSEALRSTLLRAGYVLVVMSLVLVKYFPYLGSVYDEARGVLRISGVSTNKNGLGAILLVCGLGLFWKFLETTKPRFKDRKELVAHLFLVAILVWLLMRAHSATSLACTVLGGLILVALRKQALRNLIKRLGLGTFVLVPALFIILQVTVDFGSALLWTVGRDMTLTSRTKIWQMCLHADVNSVLGAGYVDFWKGAAAKKVGQEIGFFYVLKEAHNGYIETYLNCGLTGVVLLLSALGSGANKIIKGLPEAMNDEPLRLTFVIIAMIYNLTESAFNGLNPVWFALLLSITYYPSLGHSCVPHEEASPEDRKDPVPLGDLAATA